MKTTCEIYEASSFKFPKINGNLYHLKLFNINIGSSEFPRKKQAVMEIS